MSYIQYLTPDEKNRYWYKSAYRIMFALSGLNLIVGIVGLLYGAGYIKVDDSAHIPAGLFFVMLGHRWFGIDIASSFIRNSSIFSFITQPGFIGIPNIAYALILGFLGFQVRAYSVRALQISIGVVGLAGIISILVAANNFVMMLFMAVPRLFTLMFLAMGLPAIEALRKVKK